MSETDEKGRDIFRQRMQLADAERRFFKANKREPASPDELIDWVEANGGWLDLQSQE